MKTSIELLEEIISGYGEEWKRKLNIFFERVNEGTEIEENLIEDFLIACKEDILDGNKSTLELVEKRLDNDLLYDKFKDYMGERLEAYYAIAPLRVLEKKDEKKAADLVDAVFDEAILRVSLEIEEKYSEFMLENEEEMADIVAVLDSMCTFIVSNNLSEKAMEGVIQYNVRLSKKISKYIAKKINDNFETLKTKIILQKLYSK